MHSPTYLMFEAQIEDAERNIAALQEKVDADPGIHPVRLHTFTSLQNMYRDIIDSTREAMQGIQ
jgi:hypothetical protein